MKTSVVLSNWASQMPTGGRFGRDVRIRIRIRPGASTRERGNAPNILARVLSQ